ncbi:putative quinol monooxygenase [Aerosakkonemataceae cyanobacterium BLCC-F154]|uniref:Quinol monooxygenase n=1 Tax=Floridaenema fluviatile BLCC-F154 TaxID=3153640 RepID=A0ABV4Y6Q8_9CYAN
MIPWNSKLAFTKTTSLLLFFTVVSSGVATKIARKDHQEQETEKQANYQLVQEIAHKETPNLMMPEKQVEVPVVLASRFKVKPEKRQTFLKLATAALEPTRAEAGVISYSFYEESNARNSFIYFEEWKSREALEQHLNAPYVTRLLENFPDIIDGEANIKVYDIKSLSHGLDS